MICSNPRSLPTAKIGEGRVFDLAYSPFEVVLRRVEVVDAEMQSRNERRAARLIEKIESRNPERVSSTTGSGRGIVSRAWSVEEVIEVLESQEFSDHNPSTKANPLREHYREPWPGRALVRGRTILDDPYQLAAYLRLWKDRGDAPLFNVGVAYGEMTSETEPFQLPLVNREITAVGEVIGGWTGRRASWRGDQYFDNTKYIAGGAKPRARGKGEPGLLLLYVVHRLARGRHQRGIQRSSHTPVYALAIPDGGPLLRRVVVDRRAVVDE